MNPTRRQWLQAAAAVPLLSACGAIPNPSAPGAPRVLSAAPARLPVAGQAGLDVWAYDTSVPGPVLRFRRGDWLDLELHNRLPDATTIHWHGIRLPNAMDGVPHLTQAPIEPGARFRYRFRLPDAGTFWYHPHLGTAEQVERGLAAALVVEEERPYPVDQDIVWLLDDWRLDAQGRIAEDFYRFHDVAHAGRLGQKLTVNGVQQPTQAVQAGERIRLRLINASNARIYQLALEGLPGWLIARDGVPAEAAIPWSGPMLLGPGMRADMVIDATTPGVFELRDEQPRNPAVLARLAVQGKAATARRPDPAPPPIEGLPAPVLDGAFEQTVTIGGGARSRDGWPQQTEAERAARRQRREAGAREADPAWTLNGVAHTDHHHHHEPLFSVQRGRTVRLSFDNRTAWWHPMHLHGHHFQVLSRNGQPLPDKPWRDTVLVAPGDRLEVAFVADNPGRWLIHCHVLEHHAGGMGTVFEVRG